MKVLDLFSGVGGFSLGLERAGMETVAFCEIDPFCRKVLKKHWPEIPIYEDIKKLHAENISESVDVICGGPPCQPASCAGKRKGTEDDRWLWPEVIRLVREFSPTWCVFENVPGMLSLDGGLAIEKVFIDLEGEGYEVWPFIIPACGVGLPHNRNRVWIIAHSAGGYGISRTIQPSKHCKNNGQKTQSFWGEIFFYNRGDNIIEFRQEDQHILCGEDAGVPSRVDRLRALGNAVVPQIVENIGRAIMKVENERNNIPI